MSAVVAAAARVILAAVLFLACVASLLWAALSPPGFATVVWLAVMFVTITGAVVAWEWLAERHRKGAGDG